MQNQPQNDDAGYHTPEYKDKNDEDDGETYGEARKKPSFYDDDDGDDDDDEESDEDVFDDDEETASVKSHITKPTSATAALTGTPKSTKTTDQGKHTSSPTMKPAAKPKPAVHHTIEETQSRAKNYTAHTLFAPTASALPTKGQSKTKATSPAHTTMASPKHSPSSASQTDLQLEDLFTDIPIPTPPYSKTYEAHFPLSSITLSYKPAHHGHISTTSPSEPTKTDDRFDSPSATSTWHPVPVSTGGSGGKPKGVIGGQSKPFPDLSDEDSECIIGRESVVAY